MCSRFILAALNVDRTAIFLPECPREAVSLIACSSCGGCVIKSLVAKTYVSAHVVLFWWMAIMVDL